MSELDKIRKEAEQGNAEAQFRDLAGCIEMAKACLRMMLNQRSGIGKRPSKDSQWRNICLTQQRRKTVLF